VCARATGTKRKPGCRTCWTPMWLRPCLCVCVGITHWSRIR
jgi:hypothetical protein